MKPTDNFIYELSVIEKFINEIQDKEVRENLNVQFSFIKKEILSIENSLEHKNWDIGNNSRKILESILKIAVILKNKSEYISMTKKQSTLKTYHDFFKERYNQPPTYIYSAITEIKNMGNIGSHSPNTSDDLFYSENDIYFAINLCKKVKFLIKYLVKEIMEINKIPKPDGVKEWNGKKYDFTFTGQKINSYITQNIVDKPTNSFSEINSITNALFQDNRFYIPPYQRNYVWNKEHIQILIEDIEKRCQDKRPHYFGVIAIVKDEDKTYRIVDGQQRITTMYLLLKAIYDLSKENYSTLPLELSNLFKNNGEEISNKFNSLSNLEAFGTLKDIFKSVDLGDEEKQTQFYKNYFQFKEWIRKDKIEIEKIISTLNNFVWSISTHNFNGSRNGEFELFENLNSKSKELTKFELIKNYIMGKIDQDHFKKNEIDIAKKFSDHITSLFMSKGQAKFDKITEVFLLNWLRMNVIYINEEENNFELSPQNIKDEFLFKQFKIIFERKYKNKLQNEVLSYNNYIFILKDIEKSIRIFNCLGSKNNIQTSMMHNYWNELYIVGQRNTYIPLIMDYVLNNSEIQTIDKGITVDGKIFNLNNESEFRNLMRIIETFEIRWKIISEVGQPLTNGILTILEKTNRNRIISKKKGEKFSYEKNLWNLFNEDYNNKKTESKIHFRIPSINLFKESLSTQNIKHPETIRNILFRIEQFLFDPKKMSLKKMSVNDATFEHILPKTLNKEWKSKLNDYELKHDIFLNKIGNCLLLKQKINGSLKNKYITKKISDEKYGYYKISDAKLISGSEEHDLMNITKMESWNWDDIDNRSKQLTNIAIKIWKDYK